METMKGWKRTKYCGLFGEEDIGKEVVVTGWVQRARDLGGLIFVDLRDREGILQCVFDKEEDAPLFEKAGTVRSEWVLAVKGVIRSRGADAQNKSRKTGSIELQAKELRILGEAETTPFEIVSDSNAGELLRLKYRYLDLRREPLQRNLRMRHEIARVAREYFYENDFLELETPMLIKSTPEGARDYVVPSRVHPGKFFALPQSPQIYKQLLMLSGFDRYIQLARCFRDEDLRADRQPEFTQIDLEMSFVDVDDILEMIEGFVRKLMKEIKGIDLETPLLRLTYAEAMNRFGSDKPDIRFGMEIQDLSDMLKDCGFGVFTSAIEAGGSVRAIVAPDSSKVLSRKELDKLTEMVRGIGAKGMAYIRWAEEKPSCSFAKFMSEDEMSALLDRLGMKQGDVALFIADRNSVVLPVLGALRLQVGKKLDMIPDGYQFLWITEFPFFEKDEETGEWLAMHHPFTMPLEECIPDLDTDPGSVRAKAYDLVLNGVEMCSGSIRISDPKLQDRMFRSLGLTEEEIEAKFGFLVKAYQYGAPPHGGAALGLDRLAMVLSGAESLRDVTCFPKVQNVTEPMSECPSALDDAQLEELHISLKDIES